MKVKLNEFVFDEHATVVFFPYRSAYIKHTVLVLKCETEEDDKAYRRIKERLCKKATLKYDKVGREMVACEGVEPDNHVCLIVGGTALGFSDHTLYVGHGAKIEHH